jgi:hypothetical protein
LHSQSVLNILADHQIRFNEKPPMTKGENGAKKSMEEEKDDIHAV